MGIGAFAYFVSFLLAAVQRHGDSYWAFAFPALSLCVLGADFEFNVANVSVSRFSFLLGVKNELFLLLSP